MVGLVGLVELVARRVGAKWGAVVCAEEAERKVPVEGISATVAGATVVVLPGVKVARAVVTAGRRPAGTRSSHLG